MTPVRPGFGRLFAPDSRDRAFPMRLLLDPLRSQFFPSGLPKGTRHYRSTPALDQGQTGTCVAHGWRSFLNNAPLMTKSGPKPLDMYRAIIATDEFPENDNEVTASDADLQFGTSVRAGAKYLQGLGFLTNYVWAESAEDVRAWHLAGFGTVILGIWWRDAMFETDRDGFVHYSGGYAGGHCVVTTGWNDDRDAVRIQNNWGQTWGEAGRCWMSKSDLEAAILEDGEACAATEHKVKRT